MNEAPNIRLATAADLREVASIMHESFVEYKSLYTSDAFRATTPNEDQIVRRLEEGPVWVATLGNVIAGTVSAVERGDDLYIRGMAVLPSARGNRLGELLLKRIEDFAHERNCKRLTLSTTPFLLSAIKLYKRTGFRCTDEPPNELFGTPLFTMVKKLPHTLWNLPLKEVNLC